MVVVLKHGVAKESRDQLISWLKNLGLNIHVSEGNYQTILGLVGDTSARRYGPRLPAWTSSTVSSA